MTGDAPAGRLGRSVVHQCTWEVPDIYERAWTWCRALRWEPSALGGLQSYSWSNARPKATLWWHSRGAHGPPKQDRDREHGQRGPAVGGARRARARRRERALAAS